jgi:hypothetical protein
MTKHEVNDEDGKSQLRTQCCCSKMFNESVLSHLSKNVKYRPQPHVQCTPHNVFFFFGIPVLPDDSFLYKAITCSLQPSLCEVYMYFQDMLTGNITATNT